MLVSCFRNSFSSKVLRVATKSASLIRRPRQFLSFLLYYSPRVQFRLFFKDDNCRWSAEMSMGGNHENHRNPGHDMRWLRAQKLDCCIWSWWHDYLYQIGSCLSCQSQRLETSLWAPGIAPLFIDSILTVSALRSLKRFKVCTEIRAIKSLWSPIKLAWLRAKSQK